jgi:hypothetical protein
MLESCKVQVEPEEPLSLNTTETPRCSCFPYLLERVDTLAFGVESVLFVKLATDSGRELAIRALCGCDETYHKMHSVVIVVSKPI